MFILQCFVKVLDLDYFDIQILVKLFQFISVSVFFQHFEDILKIPRYTNNHDNFGHYYCGVKCSYRYIPIILYNTFIYG